MATSSSGGRALVRQQVVQRPRRVVRERYDPRGPWECWTGPRTEVGWLIRDYAARGLFEQRGRPILLPNDMMQVDVWVREPKVDEGEFPTPRPSSPRRAVAQALAAVVLCAGVGTVVVLLVMWLFHTLLLIIGVFLGVALLGVVMTSLASSGGGGSGGGVTIINKITNIVNR